MNNRKGDALSGIPQLQNALAINEIAVKMDRNLSAKEFINELDNAADCMIQMYKSLRTSSELYRDEPSKAKHLHAGMKTALNELEKIKLISSTAKQIAQDNPESPQIAMRLAADTKLRSSIMGSRMTSMNEIIPSLINSQFPKVEKPYRRAIMDNIAENIDTLRDTLVRNAPHVEKVVGSVSAHRPSVYHMRSDTKNFNRQFREAWDYKSERNVSIAKAEEQRSLMSRIKTSIGI